MDQKQKILVCGDVKGNFKQLFSRVDSINKKSGPFEMLLCVGDFFGDNNDELIAFKNGNKVIPVPTYILGPNQESACREYENLNEGEICSNLTYLGKRGLYTISSGIKIAYVSGIEAEKSDWSFDAEDVKAVRNSCFINKTSMGEYRGIDILLTSQWPSGVDDKLTDKDDGHNGATSKLLSWLAREIKPRYHFVGLNGKYFERLPYRNSAGTNTQLELATRFIALATVGNEAKAKYVYALNIAPVDKMRLMDLIQKTTDETPCPYDSIKVIDDIAANVQDNPTELEFDSETCDPKIPTALSTVKNEVIKMINSLDIGNVVYSLTYLCKRCSTKVECKLVPAGFVDEHLTMCKKEQSISKNKSIEKESVEDKKVSRRERHNVSARKSDAKISEKYQKLRESLGLESDTWKANVLEEAVKQLEICSKIRSKPAIVETINAVLELNGTEAMIITNLNPLIERLSVTDALLTLGPSVLENEQSV